ncbi:hypothetical protein B0T21DRAFT_367194 [Apiosordaria backusii]|uniref:Hemerythrin-like domain-containing protein n=1 Tax=Apiosordaria backusii TaxID=314023 RepID=A0AA40BLS0_9PEZI|nr:hypothetical protein B0T21DRAFT_367194 [Apiosordaria backusii]
MYKPCLRVPATLLSRSSTRAVFSLPPSAQRPNFISVARMATAAGNRVSDRIKHDHRELESYYNKIKSAKSDDEKVRWQNQFVWELARHSIAEELVVYPAMEKHIPDGLKLAEKDRSEHQTVNFSTVIFLMIDVLTRKQVKNKLYEFQKMEASDPNFYPTIDSLWETLRQHIKEEEQDDLPLLEKHIDEGDSEKMATSFARTKHFVPTQSHPGAPDRPPYETVAGLLAAPIDKLMDMFKKFPSAEERNASK